MYHWSSARLTGTTTTGAIPVTVQSFTSLVGGLTSVPSPTWTDSTTSKGPFRYSHTRARASNGQHIKAIITRWNSLRWRSDRPVAESGDYLCSSQWTGWQLREAVVEIKRVTLMDEKNTVELFNQRTKVISSVTAISPQKNPSLATVQRSNPDPDFRRLLPRYVRLLSSQIRLSSVCLSSVELFNEPMTY